ncbi:P-loop containing nucleoside triphosphate hydrolase protein [Mycena floridula]|nr:P-loop containing nucleoside triphosphate hydrolase protein [Mycena floridula]
MAASGSQIHNTVKDNIFGNINGHVLSTVNNTTNNTTTIHHNYAAVTKSHTRYARGYMPVTNRKFFGRDHEIKEIVQILTPLSQSKRSSLARIFTSKPASSLRCAHIALLGAGGQGKTETALQVMAHPAIKEYYDKKNSIWVPCDEATSPELFLDVLFNSLALNQDNQNTLQAILKELHKSSKPIILLLDNFETPWNAPGARGAVARILQEIAQFSHVALLVTMRATVPPCEEIEWEEIKIQALGPKASHQLFVSLYPQLQHDPDLPDLLETVGHMALAVKLMARYGKNTGWPAKQLLSSYKATGTSMLGSAQGSDAQNSVSVSICMSLESSLVKNELNAGQLLCIIARLPSGTTPANLEQWWAPHLENRNGALRVLLEALLLECQTTTYVVLPVIRSYLLDPSQSSDDIHDSMVNAACNFLQRYNSITLGEEFFQNDMQVRSIEEINLQAILLQTSEFNTDVVNALCTLAWHQLRVRPRTEVIQHAVKLLQNIKNQHQLVASTLQCYAVILKSLNHFQESLQQYNLVREAYLAASKPTLAAWALIDVSDLSASIDSSFKEIPLLEQVYHELESIGDGSQEWRRATTICLIRLGQAHSRFHNHSEAIEHLTRARDLGSDLPALRVDCTYHLAHVHHHLRHLDEAEKMAVQILNERKHMGDYPGWSLWLLGRIYVSRAEYSKAIKSLEEGLQFAKAYGEKLNTAHILLELGRAYMKMSKDNDAKRLFSQASVNYGYLEGVQRDRIMCQYYLNKLDDPSMLPTLEEKDALKGTWHEEDIPGYISVASSTM